MEGLTIASMRSRSARRTPEPGENGMARRATSQAVGKVMVGSSGQEDAGPRPQEAGEDKEERGRAQEGREELLKPAEGDALEPGRFQGVDSAQDVPGWSRPWREESAPGLLAIRFRRSGRSGSMFTVRETI
jgi:hypothetical protein